MSIAAFSAQRFYQLATGAPVDRACTHVSLEEEIPQRGLHLIDAAPDGGTHLLWLQGIIAPSQQSERFIRDIELRRLPRPITHVAHGTGVRQAHYVSLNELQSDTRTIAALLGLTDRLIDAATQSRAAQCPTCGEVIPIFLASAEICNEISHCWRGKDIEIDLVGPDEIIERWAAEHGLTSRSKDTSLRIVRLDSFVCDETRTSQLQPLIASTRRLGEAWIAVTSKTEHKEYAWSGRCHTCCYQSRAFQKSAAHSLIERGNVEHAIVEASRLIEGITLRCFLSSSFREVFAWDTTARLVPAAQREILEKLALTELTPGMHTNALSPSTLALTALAASPSLRERHHGLVFFDAPRSLFRAKEYDSALAVAEVIAQSVPVVWLSEPPQPPQHTPPAPDTDTKAALLGRVHLHGSSRRAEKVSCGGWLSLSLPPHLHHDRLGLALHKAVQGTPSPLLTFTPLHPFSAHFIPLFSEDSTATRLVAHQVGAIEPLAKMFAASHQAKMLGLSARDFTIGQLRQSPTLCGSCRGTGILHATDGDLWREEVGPCPTCWGTRFRSPARDVTFKGKTMWEILNTSIRSSEQVLRALPKMKEVFELTTLLGLGEIALGTPTALLHTTHRRMLAIVRAMLEATATKPSIIVIEAPFVGVDEPRRAGLQKVIEHPRFKEHVAWIGVEG